MIGTGLPAQIWAGQRTATRFITTQPLDLALSTRVVFFPRTAREKGDPHAPTDTSPSPARRCCRRTRRAPSRSRSWPPDLRGFPKKFRHRFQQKSLTVPTWAPTGCSFSAWYFQHGGVLVRATSSTATATPVAAGCPGGSQHGPAGCARELAHRRPPGPLDALDGPSSQAGTSDGPAAPATRWPRSEQQRPQLTVAAAGPMGSKRMGEELASQLPREE